MAHKQKFLIIFFFASRSLPPSLRPPSLGLPPSMGGGPPPPHSLDPLLHYGGMSGLYSVGARERMELEREREFRERDLSDRFKEEMFKQRSSLEAPPPPPYAVGIPPHLLGAAGRYQTIPHTSIPTGLPPPSFYTSSPASTATLLAVERDRYERLGNVIKVFLFFFFLSSNLLQAF